MSWVLVVSVVAVAVGIGGLAGTASAVPAPDKVHTLVQPDGTTFKARQWGDEWASGWETVEGYTIRQEDEWWYYVTRASDGSLTTTDRKVGVTDPVGLQQHVRPADRDKHLRPDGGSAPLQPQGLQKSGSVKLPVILVNFNDTSTSYNQSQFDSLLFGENPSIATGPGSLRDYYQEVSYGQVDLSGQVTAWVTANKSHDYYGQDNTSANNTDINVRELVREAVRKADPQLDYSKYDQDNNGVVDGVILIHQGPGQEVSGDSTDIWSHRWAVGGGVSTNDGVQVFGYSIQPETTPSGNLTTIGVIAHETGHLFGLPDLYDTNASLEGDSAGIGLWGLMGLGGYTSVNRSGDSPAHPTAWSKSVLGWVDPTRVARSNPTGPLAPVSREPDAFQLLANPNGTSDWGGGDGEYFLLAYRDRSGFDAALPGEGLLIWHIDESQGGNANESHKLVDLEAADGNNDLDKWNNAGDAGDPFKPGDSQTIPVFTDNTTRNARRYDGSATGIVISRLKKLGGSIYLPEIVSSCRRITDPGVYALSGNLTATNEAPCIVINESNVLFDGYGYTLSGGGDGGAHGYPVVVHNFSKDFPENDSLGKNGYLSNITLKNLRAVGWSQPIHFNRVHETTVRNVTVADGISKAGTETGVGFDYYLGKRHRMVNVRAVRMPDVGVRFTSTRDVRVVRSLVRNNTYQGIALSKGEGYVISNNTVRDNLHGIQSGLQATKLIIAGNTIRSNDRRGIDLGGTQHTRVVANRVLNNSGPGIALTGSASYNNTLAENVVRRNDKAGVRLAEAEDTLVHNTIRWNDGGGVRLRALDHAVVRANTIDGNVGGGGITVNAATNVTLRNNVVTNHTRDTSGAGYGIRIRRDFDGFRAVGNLMQANQVGITVKAGQGSGEILRNRITNNTVAGVEYDFFAPIESVEVHYNVIVRNGYGIKNREDEGIANATHNWWGHSSGPSSPAGVAQNITDPITGAVANGTGDSVSENGSNAGVSNVRFDPWLSAGIFSYSNYSVTPLSVDAGQRGRVRVTVRNTGPLSVRTEKSLLIDGGVDRRTTVSMAPNETYRFTFHFSFIEPGSHTVTIDGLPPRRISVTPSWPQSGGTPGKTGSMNTTGPASGVIERWNVTRESLSSKSSPAVVNGTVYAIADGLYGFDTRTGGQRLQRGLRGVVEGPAVTNSTVYLATDGMQAIDARTGTVRWTSKRIDGHPTVTASTVYVGSDGKVYALDARTGAVLWNASVSHLLSDGPTVANGTVYIGDFSGDVHAFDAATGRVLWTASLNESVAWDTIVSPAPAVVNGTVYVGSGGVRSPGGHVWALDAQSGTELWNYTTATGVAVSPAVSNGSVYAGTYGGKLHALDARTGTERWTFRTGEEVTAPVVANGVVYFGSSEPREGGHVRAAGAKSGTELWNFPVSGGFESPPAVVNGSVYISTTNGVLYALGAAPGLPEGHTAFGNTSTLDPTRTTPAGMADDIRTGSATAGMTTVTRRRNTSTNYTLAVNVSGDATNVTFYLRAAVVAANQPINNVSLLVDGDRHPFHTVFEDGETWLVFRIEEFSTRTVRFTSVPNAWVTPGDVNDDGSVTAADATLAQRKLVGLSVDSTFVPAAADMSGDGALTAYDVTLILRAIVGLPT